MTEKDVQSLEEFNAMVDKLNEDIEAGRIESNPLVPTEETVENLDGNDIVIKETATTLGEMDIEAAAEIHAELAQKPLTTEEAYSAEKQESELADRDFESEGIVINGKFFTFSEDDEIIGNAGASLVVVSNDNGEIIFGSAAVAARETGFNPTTMRDRCKKEYVDSDGNTWQYRDK